MRAVRFDRDSPWASLELHDDDMVPWSRSQAADKELRGRGRSAPCAGLH